MLTLLFTEGVSISVAATFQKYVLIHKRAYVVIRAVYMQTHENDEIWMNAFNRKFNNFVYVDVI